jgi:hypothetical protein
MVYETIVFAVFTLHRDACNKICKTLSVVHEVQILQIHNARPEFVKKNITAINQSESSILI